jgi:hypothetical protein
MRVIENEFGSERKEITGGWRNLQDEEFAKYRKYGQVM